MKRCLRTVLFSIVIILSFSQIAQAAENDYVMEKDKKIPIPITYRPIKIIEYIGDNGKFLQGAEDLFISKDNYLYVADTQHDRIVKLTLDGSTAGVFIGPSDKALSKPEGIYVDNDGDMYIADTGNKRVIHLAPDGSYVEEFVKPESKLLGADFVFNPSKVSINSTGYIFAIKSQAFLSIDANNLFRGYIGSNKVAFDIKKVLVRIFASKDQKTRIAKKLPDSYSNFVFDERGIIYATVINASKGQIKKITSAGKNIYPEKEYGETTVIDSTETVSSFIDIAVDINGIISVIDQNSGKIYQYDQEGDMLTAFGGLGNQKGAFKIPSSIVVDDKERLYVLDKEANNIQVFEPTQFIKLVHKASALYYDGRYIESRGMWQETLKIDAKYSLAQRGIAKALFKEEKWKESMETYKLAENQEGYSQAFSQYRHSIYRNYFGLVVLGAAAALFILYRLLIFLKKYSEAALKKHMGW